jgi:hypothetical protein
MTGSSVIYRRPITAWDLAGIFIYLPIKYCDTIAQLSIINFLVVVILQRRYLHKFNLCRNQQFSIDNRPAEFEQLKQYLKLCFPFQYRKNWISQSYIWNLSSSTTKSLPASSQSLTVGSKLWPI